MKFTKENVLLAISMAFMVAYLVWAGCIVIDTWNLSTTKWENFMLYKTPLLYFALPSMILYTYVFWDNK